MLELLDATPGHHPAKIATMVDRHLDLDLDLDARYTRFSFRLGLAVL
jgi:hypothetical protein